MPNTVVNSTSNKLFAPLMGLAFFAIASGYLMSLLPLALGHYSLPVHLGPWLASVYYTGLLFGAFKAQAIISALGHRVAFVVFLLSLLVSVVFMLLLPNSLSWLVLRAVAGAATAGIFVVVESWLLFVDCDKQRASRLGFYMVTLYAGNALGQLLIEYLGTGGGLPFLCIIALLGLAIVAPLLSQNSAPQHTQHQALSLKTIATLSKPAVMGCLVSGLISWGLYTD
ncbi:MFS transporter [Agarivorans sp. TSD2052]|uniref:MFS transporter n=1 Tax=Agarivorans sp. TSD2052 TaxID=2937286 RepID=UPI0035319171